MSAETIAYWQAFCMECDVETRCELLESEAEDWALEHNIEHHGWMELPK